MTFDDWWGAYPTQEDYEANCRDAWEAGAASRDAEIAELKGAAQAVIDRWNTPIWKDVPATGEYINKLLAALAKVRKP